MPVRRRLPALLAALLVAGVCVPAAGAQTVPAPEDLPPVSEQPQVEEPTPAPEEPQEPEPRRRPTPEADRLPNTGSDARVVALLGATLILTGVGLRLRTAPEHF